MNQYQHALRPGTRIENYEIRRVLGIGGFGITYQAHDPQLDCLVAIKEFLPSGFALRVGDSQVAAKSSEDKKIFDRGLARFLDEARTLARFKLPSIVRVNRFLQANGTAYIVMDYEEGLPLSRYLRKRGTLKEGEIQGIFLPVLTGLRTVHTSGILHRDIKPGNIYLRKQGLPVLLDFGAARQALQQESKPITGMVTPGYAPFEQYNNRDKQGPWTDLYGVGATLYHCIIGEMPPASPDRIASLHAGEGDPMKSAKLAGATRFSENLLETIDWMLAPSAKDRPQTVDEVLARIAPVKKRSRRSDAASTTDASDPENVQTFMLDDAIEESGPWDPVLLQKVEKILSRYIGPLAKLLIHQASEVIAQPDQLFKALAQEIESTRERDAFLMEVRKLGQHKEPNSLNLEISDDGSVLVREGTTTRWNDDILEFARDELAKYVGPMARMLVDRAAESSRDMEELVKSLAEDIPTDDERRQFIKKVIGNIN